MKKAIVTGADGFVGRFLVKELLVEGYCVYAVVRDINRAKEIIGEKDNLIYISCDMNHYEELLEHEELRNSTILFHMAWAGVSGDLGSDYQAQLNNVLCSCDLQVIAEKIGIKRFVFADSIMEYEYQKAVENGYYQLSMRSCYPISKIAAKSFLQLQCNQVNMDFLSVIISNVYGVGESSPRLINTAVRALINHQHMSFTASEQLYDFMYITDAVRAIRIVAESGKNNKTYYIGNRKQRPLKEFLFEMRDVIAPDMKLGIGELELKGISLAYNEFDTQGLYEDFSFEPKIEFKDGIRLLSDWIKKNENE